MGSKPKQVDPPQPIVDVTEAANVAVPIAEDGGQTVRDRLRRNKGRTGRSAVTTGGLAGALSGIGISIPK